MNDDVRITIRTVGKQGQIHLAQLDYWPQELAKQGHLVSIRVSGYGLTPLEASEDLAHNLAEIKHQIAQELTYP